MPLQKSHIRPVLILDSGVRHAAEARVTERRQDGLPVFDIEVTHAGPEAVRIARVELFDLDLDHPRIEVFRQGFRMPSDAARFDILEAGTDAPPADRGWRFDGLSDREFQSHGMTAWSAGNGTPPVLTGFTTFNDFEGYFVYDLSGTTIRLKAICELEGWTLEPGKRLRLESFLTVEGRDFSSATEAYADHVAAANRARVPAATVTGWSDWQYYRMHKSEGDILQNLDGLRALKAEGYPLDYVIIDAGYYADCGWFTPNERFPSGMQALSEKIRAAGFKFGVWFDPYCTESVHSDLSRNHPEWLALNRETGEPEVGFRAHIIDYTVPEALDWLRDTVRRFVSEWDAEYIKLDGPRISIYENVAFRRENVTSVQLIRKTLEVIREACGESVLVEGEGLYGPAIGMVDVQRVQQDNWTWWYLPPPAGVKTRGQGLRENLVNELLTAFTHRRFWHNHRENVLLRDAPSPFTHLRESRPDAIEPLHTENELRSQLTAAVMAGGATLLTDPIQLLHRSPGRRSLISTFLPHYDCGCVPLDAFNGVGQPSVFVKKIERPFETWHAVAVFNWTDEHRDVEVDLAKFADAEPHHLFEFWDSVYLGKASGTCTVRDVPPHGCKMLAVRRNRAGPQLLGTSAHLLQGAVDVEDVRCGDGEMTVEVGHFRQEDERIFIRIPAGTGKITVDSNARWWRTDDRKADLLVIDFRGAGKTSFTLRWA